MKPSALRSVLMAVLLLLGLVWTLSRLGARLAPPLLLESAMADVAQPSDHPLDVLADSLDVLAEAAAHQGDEDTTWSLHASAVLARHRQLPALRMVYALFAASVPLVDSLTAERLRAAVRTLGASIVRGPGTVREVFTDGLLNALGCEHLAGSQTRRANEGVRDEVRSLREQLDASRREVTAVQGEVVTLRGALLEAALASQGYVGGCAHCTQTAEVLQQASASIEPLPAKATEGYVNADRVTRLPTDVAQALGVASGGGIFWIEGAPSGVRALSNEDFTREFCLGAEERASS